MHNIVADYDEIFSKEYLEKFDTENDYFSMELGKLEGVTDPMPRIKRILSKYIVA